MAGLFIAANSWGYNVGMHLRCLVVMAALTTGMFAQTAAPSCPADRPVDDIIQEVHQQQSKMKHRNKNPFPDVRCLWGWCREGVKTPPTAPGPASTTEAQKKQPIDKTGEESSSKSTQAAVNPCDIATGQALEAAHSVEVGDFSMEAKNYQGALMRYQDALQQKPGDRAIHVRMGRALEKLNEVPQAVEQYKAAATGEASDRWSQEAKASLQRLQR